MEHENLEVQNIECKNNMKKTKNTKIVEIFSPKPLCLRIGTKTIFFKKHWYDSNFHIPLEPDPKFGFG
jgi:hypothetical protein